MNTEKLTLEHLAPYLPYRLTVWHPETENAALIVYGLNIPLNKIINGAGDSTLSISEIKPILRPMSDLTDSIARDEYDYYDSKGLIKEVTEMYCPVGDFMSLVKKHYDVFGLIEKGLAISIHDIKK